MKTQIIAIGGGGFLTGSELGLDQYVLDQSPVAKPRIGFIATASGDAASALVKFYTRFSGLNCQPNYLSLFDRTPNLNEWVNTQDIIYVGGGNTKSMLAVWREWGLVDLLKGAMNKGTVLAGISAGAICWFEYGVTDSHADALRPLPCLGFLQGSCCPHYSGELERRPAFERLVATGAIPGGVAIDDGAAIHFVDGAPRQLAVGRAGATAYQVNRSASGIVCESLAGLEAVACMV